MAPIQLKREDTFHILNRKTEVQFIDSDADYMMFVQETWLNAFLCLCTLCSFITLPSLVLSHIITGFNTLGWRMEHGEMVAFKDKNIYGPLLPVQQGNEYIY
ncbi:hypothetical protein DFA_04611 [Cavenderia fasciculata]|uniref:Transmembrane protein n=1 Tax=Cavenderia fasciculata TaxID=261658 RepID=F4PQ20_CACFS|nr:uncharacterized protein DFA_04611 [Cavenderia fasciculata]EGG22483.1 hypothetical protein DFA_04611 [Cavenderia fasciculata]|eukprot:XP_004360334.1 hypothetical protein DFA_04611 [Cavenderia fasciculata]